MGEHTKSLKASGFSGQLFLNFFLPLIFFPLHHLPLTLHGPLTLNSTRGPFQRSLGVLLLFLCCVCVFAKEECGWSRTRNESRTLEKIKQWEKLLIWSFVVGGVAACEFLLSFFLFCCCSVAHPAAFCSLLLPLGGSHLSSLIVKTPAFQWPSCTLAER